MNSPCQYMKTIVLIDGNALMHRSYYGVNKGFIPLYEGAPIGMVFGFTSTLLHIIDQFRPDQMFVTFDTKEKTFRHDMDEEYKAQRVKAPDDFYAQIPYVYEMLESFHIPLLLLPGYESDDIIGTIAKRSENKFPDSRIEIMSGDLDFLQLVDDRVRLEKFNGAFPLQFGRNETVARFGIEPEQMVDYKAITGDVSDNYKGVAGVGPKSAASLLQKYKTLEGIYEHLDELPESLQTKFRNAREDAFHCQKLAQIHTDVPLEIPFEYKFEFTPESTNAFLEKMKFHSLLVRYQKLIKNFSQTKITEQKIDSGEGAQSEQMNLF